MSHFFVASLVSGSLSLLQGDGEPHQAVPNDKLRKDAVSHSLPFQSFACPSKLDTPLCVGSDRMHTALSLHASQDKGVNLRVYGKSHIVHVETTRSSHFGHVLAFEIRGAPSKS